MLGETVITLGNPFGLGHSVTVGVLSAKDREARYGGKVRVVAVGSGAAMKIGESGDADDQERPDDGVREAPPQPHPR